MKKLTHNIGNKTKYKTQNCTILRILKNFLLRNTKSTIYEKIGKFHLIKIIKMKREGRVWENFVKCLSNKVLITKTIECL